MNTDSKTALDYYNEAFNQWMRLVKAATWEECIEKVEQQGTVQIPDNPYEEGAKDTKGQPQCSAQHGAFYCTRERRHTGPHIAGTCGLQYVVCDIWEDKQ